MRKVKIIKRMTKDVDMATNTDKGKEEKKVTDLQ